MGLTIGSPTPYWYVGGAVLLGAMLGCGIVGFIIERLAYRPLRNAPKLNVLITAIGVSLLLQNIGQLEFFKVRQDGQTAYSLPFGPYPKAMPGLVVDRVLFTLGGVEIHLVDVIVLGT